MLTKTKIKVILVLMDNKGHAEWELARILEMEESNLNPILYELESMAIIYKKKEGRPSTNKLAGKTGRRLEYPYYLSNQLDDFKYILESIINSKKLYDAGFLFRILVASKYFKSMQKQYSDLKMIMMDVLRNNYPPFSDPFFINIIEPELDLLLERNLDRCLPLPSEIEKWYSFYKDNWNSRSGAWKCDKN